jgi:hypothetical protein
MAEWMRVPGTLSRQSHRQLLLLAPEGEAVVSANTSCAAIWDVLVHARGEEDIVGEVAAYYGQDVDEVRAALGDVLQRLEVLGVVQRVGAS